MAAPTLPDAPHPGEHDRSSMRRNSSSHLRLVPPEADATRQRAIEEWLLGPAPDPLPDDTLLIVRLEGAPQVPSWQVRAVIDKLLAEGRIHRVHIGSRRHLTRLAESDDFASEERFRLNVELDLEAEKQLLLKTVLVLESLVLLAMGRELVLRWIGS